MSTYELDDALVRRFLDGATFSGDELEILLRSQLPKPTVEEPIQWGSEVRASWGDHDREPWSRRANGYWENASGLNAPWPDLLDVEVLRVGVGKPADEAWPVTVEDCNTCRPVVEAFVPDPVEAEILFFSQHLYDTAASMSEEMVEFNLRTFLTRALEAGKAA